MQISKLIMVKLYDMGGQPNVGCGRAVSLPMEKTLSHCSFVKLKAAAAEEEEVNEAAAGGNNSCSVAFLPELSNEIKISFVRQSTMLCG